MAGLIKKEDIEKSKRNSEFIKQTAYQIIKDFGMFGMDIQFSGNVIHAYSELFNQLDKQISFLIENKYEMLMSLLYQIDINEAKMQQAEEDMPGYTLSEKLSKIIIERELVKVLTRNYFKDKGYK